MREEKTGKGQKPIPRNRISRRAREVPPSAIRRLFEKAQHLSGVISLGIGEPDFITPHVIRAAATRSIEQGYTKYTSNFGLANLRTAIADHLFKLRGVQYDAKTEILVTIGVAEGLDLAFRSTLDPGDEVLIPEPAYLNYGVGVRLSGAVPIFIPTSSGEGFRFKRQALQRAVTPRTKGIVLGYPSNPTGVVLTASEVAMVAEFAEANDLIVYSDEIYDRLVYAVPYRSVIEVPRLKERTVYLGGFSKAYAMTGWRVGYACAPEDVIQHMMRLRQYSTLCPPSASQYAALGALEHGEAAVLEMVDVYRRRRDIVIAAFDRIGLPCVRPDGAMYAFPEVAQTGLSDEEFSERLLDEERVVVVPGRAFGDAGTGHVRVCYALETDQIYDACGRIERFINRL